MNMVKTLVVSGLAIKVDLQAIRRKQNRLKDKSLIKLNPTKDGEGLLIVRGRLRFASDRPYDQNIPYSSRKITL